MSVDAVFNGVPNSRTQASGRARLGVNINTNELYVDSPVSAGWRPVGSGGGFASVSIDISAAELYVAHGTPVLAIPGVPGFGIAVRYVTSVFTPGNVLFDVAINSPQVGTLANPALSQADGAVATDTDTVPTVYGWGGGVFPNGAGVAFVSDVSGAAIYFSNASSQEPTVGNGSLRLVIEYELIALS